jgi:hypothetical protein
MNKTVMTLMGAWWLVGCGSEGVPWEGAPEPDFYGPGTGSGGAFAVAGGPGVPEAGSSSYAGTSSGGFETAGTSSHGGAAPLAGSTSGGTGYGGYAAGGTEAGGFDSGGSGYGGSGFAGAPYGGYSAGGTGSGGSGPDDSTCWQNVAHCLDAAASCYEFSPWSDCDQIVDVCTAMQMDCDD